jgi:hypothetical protein
MAKWKKGESGNPTGKKPGTLHKATRAAQALLDGEAQAHCPGKRLNEL